MAIVPRFLHLPAGGSAFVFGPRGTGKTTWLREVLPEALHLNLLRADLYRELSARPERLSELVLGNPDRRVVVIDEIQRIPELLHGVHDLLESGAARQFVMTGSSARKLRRGGVDLLAGRAVLRTLHPFMAAEMSAFSLDATLETGLVPLVVMSEDATDVLSSYAGLYLEQEVMAGGLVRNIGGFARFLEVVSFSHAAVLNLSHIARESQVPRKTVEGYLEILEDLLLAYRVPVFARRAQRQLVAHPKLFLFDVGVYRALRPRGPLDRPEEIGGPALEGLVAQHLRAWIAYSGSDCELSYWRTRAGVEVDLVVYGAGGFWAVEVKNSAQARPADVQPLASFIRDYPEAEPVLLYRGTDRLLVGGIRCIPADEFLRELRPGRGLTDPFTSF
jgi:predicted AAA+ superfamily ATPase